MILKRRLYRLSWGALLLFLVPAACVLPGKSPYSPPPGKGPRVTSPAVPRTNGLMHTVQWPGESLSIISQWYTGDPRNWGLIARENRHRDPHRIYVGDRILLPDALLKTREPMPRKYVEGFRRKPEGKGANRDTAPPVVEENLTLFGPRPVLAN
jgi:hypothetical protein